MSNFQIVSSILQNIPLFKGKRRIARMIVKVARYGKLKDIDLRTKSGRFRLPNIDEIISFDLFVNGAYEKGLVKYLSNSLPPDGVFIDVGANIGSITIPLALKRPDVKIISIEASPWIYNVLKGNIYMNGLRNVSAVNYAVFKESGKEMPIYAPKDLFGKGSLNPVFTKDAELVQTITLDDIKHKFDITKVDYIKVDVEGFEAAVFMGMQSIVHLDKPKLIFEHSEWAESTAGFTPGEAQNIILKYGYRLQLFDSEFNLIGEPGVKVIFGNGVNIFAF